MSNTTISTGETASAGTITQAPTIRNASSQVEARYLSSSTLGSPRATACIIQENFQHRSQEQSPEISSSFARTHSRYNRTLGLQGEPLKHETDDNDLMQLSIATGTVVENPKYGKAQGCKSVERLSLESLESTGIVVENPAYGRYSECDAPLRESNCKNSARPLCHRKEGTGNFRVNQNTATGDSHSTHPHIVEEIFLEDDYIPIGETHFAQNHRAPQQYYHCQVVNNTENAINTSDAKDINVEKMCPHCGTIGQRNSSEYGDNARLGNLNTQTFANGIDTFGRQSNGHPLHQIRAPEHLASIFPKEPSYLVEEEYEWEHETFFMRNPNDSEYRTPPRGCRPPPSYSTFFGT